MLRVIPGTRGSTVKRPYRVYRVYLQSHAHVATINDRRKSDMHIAHTYTAVAKLKQHTMRTNSETKLSKVLIYIASTIFQSNFPP